MGIFLSFTSLYVKCINVYIFWLKITRLSVSLVHVVLIPREWDISVCLSPTRCLRPRRISPSLLHGMPSAVTRDLESCLRRTRSVAELTALHGSVARRGDLWPGLTRGLTGRVGTSGSGSGGVRGSVTPCQDLALTPPHSPEHVEPVT